MKTEKISGNLTDDGGKTFEIGMKSDGMNIKCQSRSYDMHKIVNSSKKMTLPYKLNKYQEASSINNSPGIASTLNRQ